MLSAAVESGKSRHATFAVYHVCIILPLAAVRSKLAVLFVVPVLSSLAFSASYFRQKLNVTDGQTDRQTDIQAYRFADPS